VVPWEHFSFKTAVDVIKRGVRMKGLVFGGKGNVRRWEGTGKIEKDHNKQHQTIHESVL
jgi:hypothetical protein